ncbi:hypothetical protein PV08_10128 [Exophiala spinifera]|uniref:DNA replication complex GINS protein SLD5 n=1 Tax=Exophiala spinifera TaxID=91928 RepID=A0A0D2BHI7_9EURO|nr:uncharacterized protein PV08_10128 [Exophiala spinifera]KIW10829.1 hypothetical protein PV08_10128 [Exophiala spinifera]
MDLDISDILADVSRPAAGAATGSLSHSASDTDTFTDHQLLVRAWTSERCAPDLLPYPTDLLYRVMSRVQSQISRIEDMAAGVGGDGVGGGGGQASVSGGGMQNSNLVLSILQTDLGRTQFLVRSFLRVRLAKLTKYATYYLRLTTERKTACLSAAEAQFVANHQALLGEFYDASFLSAFPAGLRRLDDVSAGVSMVEGPDVGSAVVVRCLAELWGNEDDIENAAAGAAAAADDDDDQNDEDNGPTVELRMRGGEIWIVRWRDVKAGVERGDVELL